MVLWPSAQNLFLLVEASDSPSGQKKQLFHMLNPVEMLKMVLLQQTQTRCTGLLMSQKMTGNHYPLYY